MQDESAALRSGYAAFISYSHRDEKIAAWLQNAIERTVVPKRLVGRTTPTGVIPRRLGKCFRDRDELPAGSDLGREIVSAIEHSKFMVVICSPAAAESPWVNQEVLTFKRTHGADRVIAVIADGEPFAKPGDAMAECLPLALRFHLGIDGNLSDQPAEPIAADLRPGKDPKRIVVLKVLAGMFGLGLDELVQRAAQRRQRVYGWIAGGSALASVAFAGLAVMAFQQRNIAIRATAIAADRRTQAEGLIEFMITDLHDKLTTVGRLDVLDAVTDRALAYFESLSSDEMDATAAGQKTQILGELGNQERQRGHQKKALEIYRLTWESAQSALAKAPNDPNRIFEYAETLNNLGVWLYSTGDLVQSEKYFDESINFYNKAISIKNNDNWRHERAKAQKNLGTVYFNEMKLKDSINALELSKTEFEKIISVKPDDIASIAQYSDVIAWNSDALRQIGATKDAIALRQSQRDIHRKVLAATPNDRDTIARDIAAQRALANLKGDMGNFDKSYQDLISIEQQSKKLYEFDPNNMSLRKRFVATSIDLAQSAIIAGYVVDGEIILSRAQSEVENIIKNSDGLNKSNLELKQNICLTETLLWITRKEYQKAIVAATPTINIFKNYKKIPQETYEDFYRLSSLLYTAYLASLALEMTGHEDEAKSLYHQIVDHIEGLPTPRSVVFEAINAATLSRLGYKDEENTSLAFVCQSEYRRVIGMNSCKN